MYPLLGHSRDMHEVDRGIYITDFCTSQDKRVLKDFRIRNIFSLHRVSNNIWQKTIVYNELNINHILVPFEDEKNTHDRDYFYQAYQKLISIYPSDNNRCIIYYIFKTDIAYAFIIYYLSKRYNQPYPVTELCLKKRTIGGFKLTRKMADCLPHDTSSQKSKKYRQKKSVRFANPLVSNIPIKDDNKKVFLSMNNDDPFNGIMFDETITRDCNINSI